jgi:phage gpG-like protein
MSVEVKGAATFQTTTALAAADLGDMREPGQASAAQLLASARSKAPRLTGRLASSLTADTGPALVEVGSGLEYAGRTHYGWPAVGQQAQPFLTDALAELDSTILDNYQHQVEKALNKVKGA